MLRDALAYPLRWDEVEAVYLPGLVLAFATALAVELPGALALAALVPATPLVGYLGAVYAAAIDGEPAPPPFGRPVAVVRRGVALLALAALYLLPAAVALGVTVAGVGSSPATESLSNLGLLRVLAGTTGLFLLVVGAAYLATAAAGVALAAGDLRAGLAVRTVAERATDGAFFTGFWVAVVLVAVALWAWAALALVLGRAGSALGVVAAFHALVAAAYLLGRGFGTEGPLYEML